MNKDIQDCDRVSNYKDKELNMHYSKMSSEPSLTYTTINTNEPTLIEKIEVVIKALGTMVLEPKYEMNKETFVNEFAGSIQHPIIEGEQRKDALNTLSQLISQL